MSYFGLSNFDLLLKWYRVMVTDFQPQDLPKADWPPFMPWESFADWVRVEPGIVRGWLERGYLPSVVIGRRRMINLVKLLDQLKEGDQ